MSDDREVRKETDFWGNEKEVIYQDGEKVGEIHTEERGGFFGLGAETTKVEYDAEHNEVSHTTKDERGGLFGIGSEEVDVKRDTDGNELSTSRVEERGGFLGIGSHYVSAERDSNGDLISESNHERRGGFLGFGGEKVRVTRHAPNSSTKTYSNSQKSGADYSSHYQATSSSRRTNNVKSGSAFGLIVFIIIAVMIGYVSIEVSERNKIEEARKAAALEQRRIEEQRQAEIRERVERQERERKARLEELKRLSLSPSKVIATTVSWPLFSRKTTITLTDVSMNGFYGIDEPIFFKRITNVEQRVFRGNCSIIVRGNARMGFGQFRREIQLRKDKRECDSFLREIEVAISKWRKKYAQVAG